jgi:hypothetical protein
LKLRVTDGVAYLRRDAVPCLDVAHRERDLGTRAGECACRRYADSGRRARDNGALARKIYTFQNLRGSGLKAEWSREHLDGL